MSQLLDVVLASPLACLVTAKRFSGKTYFVKQLLQDARFAKRYDQIIVFLGSPDSSLEDCQYLHQKSVTSFRQQTKAQRIYIVEWNVDLLQRLLEKQATIKAGKETLPKMLLIFDDCVNYLTNAQKSIVNTLPIKSRHYNVDYIFVSQSYVKAPPVWRTNSTCKVFLSITNQKELKKILDENESIKFDASLLRELFLRYLDDYKKVALLDARQPRVFIIDKMLNTQEF